MGNPGVDFQMSVDVQHRIDRILVGQGMTVGEAYELASWALNQVRIDKGLVPPSLVRAAKEVRVTSRKPCTVHREKSFTFSDGTVWKCCTHDECGWGKPHPSTGNEVKKHSDGLPVAIPEVELTDDGEGVVEVSSDDPTELSVEGMIAQPHVESEEGVIAEPPEQEEFILNGATDANEVTEANTDEQSESEAVYAE